MWKRNMEKTFSNDDGIIFKEQKNHSSLNYAKWDKEEIFKSLRNKRLW